MYICVYIYICTYTETDVCVQVSTLPHKRCDICKTTSLQSLAYPYPWADPKSRSTLQFYNLRHRNTRVQNWGISFLDPAGGLGKSGAQLRHPLGAAAVASGRRTSEKGSGGMGAAARVSRSNTDALRRYLPRSSKSH